MLTDLQEKKMTKMFNAFDLDGNGVVEGDDYKIICRNLGDIRGWEEDSPEYQALYSAIMEDWENTKNFYTRTENSEQIALEDWLAFYDSVLQSKALYDVSVAAVADKILDLFDFNQDGKLQFEEFCAFFNVHNIDRSEAEEVFPKLDTDNKGYLTREEILEVIDEFFKSDDPNAKGNLLFGPL